jgi:proline utilization trans-activator
LDIDTIFSVGFIYVLVEVIYPTKISGTAGIEGVRVILQYLNALGNQGAKKRLAEIDHMRSYLSSQLQQGQYAD